MNYGKSVGCADAARPAPAPQVKPEPTVFERLTALQSAANEIHGRLGVYTERLLGPLPMRGRDPSNAAAPAAPVGLLTLTHDTIDDMQLTLSDMFDMLGALHRTLP